LRYCPARLADIVYHLEDIAGQIAVSQTEIWDAVASQWTKQSPDWKSSAALIIDRLGAVHKVALLRAVIQSNLEEDATLAANLVSQIGANHLGDLTPFVVDSLEKSWHAFPAHRSFISVCAKAGGLTLRVGA